MKIINPFESKVVKDMEKAQLNYSPNKKTNLGLSWGITAVVLLVLGFFTPAVSIFFVAFVCAISGYYINSAKKEVATNVKKLKAARIITTTVVIILAIILILNILSVSLLGVPK